MPTISVLMSVYNEPIDWIQLAIDSILTQTFADFEFIIINDKPDRLELKELLECNAAKDSRIRIHTNPENIGLTKSLNVGLKLCTGKYIARMDADDISLPERFKKQIEFMEGNPDIVVCGTNIEYFGAVPVMTFSDWIYSDSEKIKAQMLSNSGFAHPSVMIRVETLKYNNIKYDENYRQAQDYRMWEIIREYGEFANLSEKLLKYRLSENQVSKKSSGSQIDAGLNIRRRIRHKWLIENEIFINENHITVADIKQLSHIIKENKKLRFSGLIFIRSFYFSRNNKKLKHFMYCILLGHFFKFSLKDKLRYVAIMLGKKKPIEW